FDLELTRIRDVAEQIAAAVRIGERLAAIRGRLLDRERLREGDAFPDPLDSRAHALAGNRAGDEHDLTLDARDHPAAGGRFVDREREGLAGRQHESTLVQPSEMVGSPKRSRTS